MSYKGLLLGQMTRGTPRWFWFTVVTRFYSQSSDFAVFHENISAESFLIYIGYMNLSSVLLCIVDISGKRTKKLHLQKETPHPPTRSQLVA